MYAIMLVDAQAFCWEALDVAVELLVDHPPSADAGTLVSGTG